MNFRHFLSSVACAAALLTLTASAVEKKGTCCEKAAAEGKKCTMKCCVAAHRDGKSCEYCNKNKEDMKKDGAKADTKASKAAAAK